jgi:hypothetical protein
MTPAIDYPGRGMESFSLKSAYLKHKQQRIKHHQFHSASRSACRQFCCSG